MWLRRVAAPSHIRHPTSLFAQRWRRLIFVLPPSLFARREVVFDSLLLRSRVATISWFQRLVIMPTPPKISRASGSRSLKSPRILATPISCFARSRHAHRSGERTKMRRRHVVTRQHLFLRRPTSGFALRRCAHRSVWGDEHEASRRDGMRRLHGNPSGVPLAQIRLVLNRRVLFIGENCPQMTFSLGSHGATT